MNSTELLLSILHQDLCQAIADTRCRIMKAVWIGAPLFFIISGTIMNLFCLIILTRTRTRKYSISIFLSFLACSDSCVLWSMVFRNLLVRLYDVDLRNLSAFSCHAVKWLATTSSIYSSCILVCISAERCILARFPIKMRNKINARSNLIVSVVMLAVVATMCGHSIVGHEYVERADVNPNTTTPEYVCQTTGEGYEAFLKKWVGFLFVFYVFCCVAIVVCNTYTACLLRRQAKRVQNAYVFVKAAERRRRANFIVLLVVTSNYVIMTLPSIAFLLFLKMTVSDIVVDDRLATWQLVYLILMMMFWSNYSFNFLLYLMSGSNFRKECTRIKEDLTKWMSSN